MVPFDFFAVLPIVHIICVVKKVYIHNIDNIQNHDIYNIYHGFECYLYCVPLWL